MARFRLLFSYAILSFATGVVRAQSTPGPQPDLARYCVETFGCDAKLSLDGPDAYSWRCHVGSQVYSLSVNDACKEQFQDPGAYSGYAVWEDPNSWYCHTNNTRSNSTLRESNNSKCARPQVPNTPIEIPGAVEPMGQY